MKRMLSILVTLSMLLAIFAFPADAQAVEENESSPQIGVLTESDGTINITIRDTSKNEKRLLLSGNQTRSSTVTSIAFFPDSEEERNEILERIDQVRGSGGTIYDEDWFFGSSCYASVSLTYTSKDSSVGTVSRIESVTTQYAVKNGTYLTSAVLNVDCHGSTADSTSATYDYDIAITSSPYSTTYPRSWPYISHNGIRLGASFTVVAQRPSGSSSSHTVSTNVFAN